MKLIRNARLFFREGNSDKVYEVDLCDLGSSRGEAHYVVNFRYGRRGSALREGTKTTLPVILEEANKIFDSVVVSKTNKGYRPVEDDSPLVEAPADMATAAGGRPEELRAQAVLGRLAEAPQKTLTSNEIKRAVWRAGELRLHDAAVPISRLLGQDDDLLDYCIAWSLGRCGDAAQLSVLDSLRRQYGENFVGAMAREAQLALLDESGRIAMLNRIKESLPDFVQHAVATNQTAQIVSALEKLVKRPPVETVDAIVDLYALALDDGAVHEALSQLLPSLKLGPNIFKAVRRLFKVAEFRQDAKIYGLITHLIDMTSPYYNAPEYGSHAYDPNTQCYLPVAEELKKKAPAFAYSNRTRDYLRRRSWRTLRRFADLGSEQYVAFAAEMLLAVDDPDARPEQVIEYYDYELGSYVSRTYDRYGHLFTFNHILNSHNPRIKLSGSGKMWLIDKSVAEVVDFRGEAYAELWDQAPQTLLRLLMESRCDAVHTFAVRALKCNQEFVQGIGSGPAGVMLTMPYESTAHFALDIARRLVRSGCTDIELIGALLCSPIREAHELAQETLRLNPALLTDDIELAYALITGEHEDNRLWLRRFTVDHPWSEAIIRPLVARLIAGAMQLGREDDDRQAIIADIGWMLINSLGNATRTLGFDVITDLLDEKSVAVQLLGAQLVLNHATPVAALPPAMLRKLLEAKSGDVRALGTQLFGRLSDEVLLAQPALVLKLALSHDAQVRQAAQPVIHRLAQASSSFAALALERLIDSLFRSEPAEGFHDDILQLVKESLATTAQSIDVDTNWRLLQARSKGAQRYGAHLLDRWSPQDFSVRQLGRLAGNPVLSVRQWAWRGYEQQVERIKADARNALVIFDTQWEDCRQFARDYFDRHFGADDWNPELLIDICDSTRDDVQDYGRQLIMRFFDEQDGVNYLLKLSQHPSNKVQLFVSQFLHQYAADNIDNLERLRHYFMTVLSKVNQARPAKSRITDFLRNEALKSPQAARFVADIFSRQSVTSAIVDKSACIDMLLRIRQRYPELDSPLTLVGARQYEAGREASQ